MLADDGDRRTGRARDGARRRKESKGKTINNDKERRHMQSLLLLLHSAAQSQVTDQVRATRLTRLKLQ